MNDSPGPDSPGPASCDPGLPGTSATGEPGAGGDPAAPAQAEPGPQHGASEDAATGPREQLPAQAAPNARQDPAAPASQPLAEADRPQGEPGLAPQGAALPNWSQQQPPPQPGMWGAAAPPGPPPPPGGWGGGSVPGWAPQPPGWGAVAPPAPQPGVIPLRPLGFGEMLSGAMSMARIHWRTVLGVALVLAAVAQSGITAVSGFMANAAAGIQSSTAGGRQPDPATAVHAIGAIGGSLALLVLISAVLQALATALMGVVASRSVLGKPLRAREGWAEVRPRLPRILGLAVLQATIPAGVSAVGVGPGILLGLAGSPTAGLGLGVLGWLAAIPVAVWIVVRLSLAAPALILERQGVFAALSRSMRLVRGSWWRVFGIQLVTVVLGAMISAVVSTPFSLLGMTAVGQGAVLFATAPVATSWTYQLVAGIGSTIGTMLTLPLTTGVTVLLYIDQRIRREGLDLELARAAAH